MKNFKWATKTAFNHQRYQTAVSANVWIVLWGSSFNNKLLIFEQDKTRVVLRCCYHGKLQIQPPPPPSPHVTICCLQFSDILQIQFYQPKVGLLF